MDNLTEFIRPELLVLIPVLNIMGVGFKRSNVADKYIPVLLGFASIFLAALYTIFSSSFISYKDIALCIFTSVTQGVLLAGASVYFNQIIKQMEKDETKND